MDKINFNKFIWFTGKLKKKIGWFSNSWNEKKKWCEKKKREAVETKLDGLLPLFLV